MNNPVHSFVSLGLIMDEGPESDSPAAALLVRRDSDTEDEPLLASTTMTRLGVFRAYWLGCVVCIGGFLFGYDRFVALLKTVEPFDMLIEDKWNCGYGNSPRYIVMGAS